MGGREEDSRREVGVAVGTGHPSANLPSGRGTQEGRWSSPPGPKPARERREMQLSSGVCQRSQRVWRTAGWTCLQRVRGPPEAGTSRHAPVQAQQPVSQHGSCRPGLLDTFTPLSQGLSGQRRRWRISSRFFGNDFSL